MITRLLLAAIVLPLLLTGCAAVQVVEGLGAISAVTKDLFAPKQTFGPAGATLNGACPCPTADIETK